MVDANPSDKLIVEVAFASAPMSASPTWEPLTSRLRVDQGVTITRGRQSERDQIAPGQCSLALDNTDGALTPGNPGSPYYPNVLPQRRIRIRYADPDNGTRSLFDGFVDRWPVTWPQGGQEESLARITATDLLGRLAAARRMRSVLEYAIRDAQPLAYWPLIETSGSAGAIDTSGTWPLAVEGSAGAVDFGSGATPVGDTRGTVTFAPESPAAGRRLVGAMPPVGVAYGIGTVRLELVVATSTTAGPAAIARLEASGNRDTWLEVGVAADGKATLTASYVRGGTTYTATAATVRPINDGRARYVELSWDSSASPATVALLIDSSSADTDGCSATLPNLPLDQLPALDTLALGGRTDAYFEGSIGHVSTYSSLSVDTSHSWAASGYDGQSVGTRMTSAADWLGIPSSLLSVPATTATPTHVPTEDKTPAEYFQVLADVEGGALYVSASGVLTLASRLATITRPATPTTLDARMLGEDAEWGLDLTYVVNDVTATRPGGSAVHVSDQASIDEYGLRSVSLEISAASDDQVAGAANWRLAPTPIPRLSSAELDGFTDPTYSGEVRRIDLLSCLQITGPPSQAPAPDYHAVQGVEISISVGSWTVKPACSPGASTYLVPWIVEDPVLGSVDGPGVVNF